MLSLWHTLSHRAKKKEEKEDNQAVNDVFFSLKGAISGGERRKGFFHRLFTIYTNDLAVRCSAVVLPPPPPPPPATGGTATCCLAAFALRHAVCEQ